MVSSEFSKGHSVKLFAFAFCMAFFVSGALAQDAEETPAEPRWKGAPDYPVLCLRGDVEPANEERVDVAFKITAEGLTQDVRVMRSTNACFEEAALAAVRSWVYTPRRVNGQNQPQEDMEATFIFEIDSASPSADPEDPERKTKSRALVFDARPIERTPPEYPVRCRPKAYANEYVVVEYDVTIDGETTNHRIKESTNDCFNESALEALGHWKFEPRVVDGEATDRADVRTLVIFRLDFGRARPENAYRPAIRRRLGRVRRLLEREKIQDAFALLQRIETKYGDSMSQAELADFHRMRAMARIGADDLYGALDDLRVAKRLDPRDPENALQNLIAELEAALGASSDTPPADDADSEETLEE